MNATELRELSNKIGHGIPLTMSEQRALMQTVNDLACNAISWCTDMWCCDGFQEIAAASELPAERQRCTSCGGEGRIVLIDHTTTSVCDSCNGSGFRAG